jgi:hypothetical protein
MSGNSGFNIWGGKKNLPPPDQNNNNQNSFQPAPNNQRNFNNNFSGSNFQRNPENNVFSNNYPGSRINPPPMNPSPFLNQQNPINNQNRQSFSNKFDGPNPIQRQSSTGDVNRGAPGKQVNSQRQITQRLNAAATSQSPHQKQTNASPFQESPRNRLNLNQNVPNYNQPYSGAFKNKKSDFRDDFRNASNLNQNQSRPNTVKNIFNNQGQQNNVNPKTNKINNNQQGVNDTISSIAMDEDSMMGNFSENNYSRNPPSNKFINSTVPDFEFTNDENSHNYSFKAQDARKSGKDFQKVDNRAKPESNPRNQQNIQNTRAPNQPKAWDRSTRPNPKIKNTEMIREDNEYDQEQNYYEDEGPKNFQNKNRSNPPRNVKVNKKAPRKDDDFYFQQMIKNNKEETNQPEEVVINEINENSPKKRFGKIRKKSIKNKDDSNFNDKDKDNLHQSGNRPNMPSNLPKPKIDLSKINELKNKQKEMIESLENKDRKKSLSPSPIGVNLIRSNKEDERLEKFSHKEKTLENYIPKKMGEFINSATDKARLITMCSPREMKAREEQNVLNILESDPNLSYYDANQKRYVIRVNPDNAVKVYSRPAADTVMDDPDNIRPPIVLTKTIDYLLEEIVDIDTNEEKQKKIFRPDGLDLNFGNISKFVEDRFRSIRQDFTILNLKGDKNNIDGHEKIARFLILCLNETLDYDAFSGQQSLFKLYVQQLNATMTSLREFYEYVEERLTTENSDNLYISPNQAEFYAYSILLSIKETFDLVSMLNKMPDQIRDNEKIKLTLKIVRAIMGKEWLSFFRILISKECDYLLSCVMSLYFKEMRSAALSELSHSYGIKIKDSLYKTTIEKLNDILLFQDKEECIRFLDWFGNDTSAFSSVEDDQDIEKIPFDLVSIGLIGEDANLPRKTNRRFIDAKRIGRSRCDIIK